MHKINFYKLFKNLILLINLNLTMRPKTIIILILILLITMVILQFIYNANFTMLITDVPKWEMICIVAVLSFILGILIGRPGRSSVTRNSSSDDSDEPDNSNTLSDEDRKYIS
jgi:membrane-associated PAP2 superfamily phosphatase